LSASAPVAGEPFRPLQSASAEFDGRDAPDHNGRMGWKLDNSLGTWTVLGVLFALVILILFALVAFLSLFALRR
jgi:hypothetical protein